MKKAILQLVIVGGVASLLALLEINVFLISITAAIAAFFISFIPVGDRLPPLESDSTALDKEFFVSGDRISHSASRIAIGGATVSHFLDKLSEMFKQQVENVKEIAERIRRLEQGNEELINYAGQAQAKIMDSDQKTQQCTVLLNQMLGQQRTLSDQINDAKELLQSLRVSAESIGSITTTINQLADQTNMLALNAAIEAARAGEQGRGFAVVADEVRELAKKTTHATQGIDNVLSDINKCSQASVESIERVASEGEQMSTIISETSLLIQDTSLSSSQAASAMAMVKDTVNLHGDNNRGISVNVMQLHDNTSHLESDLTDVSEKVLGLSHQTEDIFRQLQVFNLRDRNSQVQHIAQEAAKRIGLLFENAIANGDISEGSLFDFAYQPLPNTNPQKYNTGFDSFTDRVLPDIQEPILSNHSFIVYAGAIDKNGYFPTHNRKFSQPMTGNYETDLANSRTKRIFNDYTGSRCGQNKETFLLQTYKRDTGEVMHDLSAPIFVNGKHWGGFRIGYKADD